jgi:tripeptidyl-peptidase-1
MALAVQVCSIFTLYNREIWTMLFRFLVAALTCGFVFETAANPIAHSGSRTKDEAFISRTLHESHLPHWSKYWSKKSKVPDTQILPMRIGLKQSNLDAGHDRLMDM